LHGRASRRRVAAACRPRITPECSRNLRRSVEDRSPVEHGGCALSSASRRRRC
jgi:hypothetical protein